MGSRWIDVNDILAGHVRLDIECLDRIYLNGYVPNWQVAGQVVQYPAARGFPIHFAGGDQEDGRAVPRRGAHLRDRQ